MSGSHHGLGRSREILWPMRIAIALNYTFAIVEFVVYFFSGHSVAVLAAASENMVHGTVWLASHQFTLQSLKPADQEYTYGRQGYGVFIPLLNAIFLLMAGVFIFSQALARVQNPQEVAGLLIMIVAIADTVSNIGQVIMMWKYHDHRTILSGMGHIMSDLFAGLAVIASGFIIWQFGIYGIDGFAAIAIACFSLAWGVWFVWPVKSFLLHQVPATIQIAEVQEFILAAFPSVSSVHDLHVDGLAEDLIKLECHMVVPDPMVDLDRLKGKIRAALHNEERFHVEHCTFELERQQCTDPCALEAH